ncbi:spore germination protein GerPE [Gracilibacillus xinjiangensis]|uniref:Spore germination protein GerPE n=1 Tax=Gracilibacillus xinjiangensis TaxID=1193282 RepID=A0ABV8WUR8_9BACI
MNTRTTKVKEINVSSVAYSSIFNIGDSKFIEPKTDVLAVQREGDVPSDKGFNLEQYPIFTVENYLQPNKLQINQQHIQHHPTINVSKIGMIGMSSSSVLQIGNVNTVKVNSRTKHIRIVNVDE